MRNRSRSRHDSRARQDDSGTERHGSRARARAGEEERTRPVRIPKIQYRFLKEIEERPLAQKDVDGALAMAGKVKRYPLAGSAVMASWERYTRKAIEEYKAGTGDAAARDQQHRAYAVLFQSLRDKREVKDLAELQAGIHDVARKNAARKGADSTEPLPPREARATSGEAVRPRAEAATAKEVPSQKRDRPEERSLAAAPAANPRQPRQRSLDLPEQTFGHERTSLDARVDKMLGRLREIPPDLRATIETSAREVLGEGLHTPKSAREALPAALEELRAERSPENAVHALTLATVARVPEHAALLRELLRKGREEYQEIVNESRARLERYPALDSAVSLVRRDQIAAAVRDVLEPSAEGRREALVLAYARDELEHGSHPQRAVLARLARELVSSPA